MNSLKDRLYNNKRLIFLFTSAFGVFINCFVFPIYNFEKNFGLLMQVIDIFICIDGFFYTGVMFNYCFKEKPKCLKVILLTLAYTFLGMACRYLLEFGEVSNTYNFTAENIALHILMSCLVTYFGWFWYRRKSEN